MNSDIHLSARARRSCFRALPLCFAPMIAVCVLLAPAAPAQAALVNYWKFDGDFFDTADNYAGHNSTADDDMNGGTANFIQVGPLAAGPTARTGNGQIVLNSNRSLIFAGIPGTTDVMLGTHWTVGFWLSVQRIDPAGLNFVFSDALGNNVDDLRLLYWGPGNGTTVTANEWRLNNSSGSPLNASPITQLNEWVYWTVVQDGANWQIYRDGQLLQDQPTSRTGGTVPQNDRTLVIGNSARSDRNGENLFANMSSWDNAFSAQEVMALYQNDGAPGFGAVPEPSSLALAAFGLMSLGLFGWRKKTGAS